MLCHIDLIVVADDLGYSRGRDEGILESMRDGAVTATSLLVNGASADAAMKTVPSAYLSRIGLHLNLTEGLPVAVDVPSLLLSSSDDYYSAHPSDPRFSDSVVGCLRGKLGFREALKSGLIRQDEIAREVRAQVDRFMSLHPLGQPPAHLDGHQHVHVLPEVREAIKAVMEEKEIRYLRIPRISPTSREDSFIRRLRGDPSSASRAAFYETVSKDAEEARGYLSASTCSSDHFIGFSIMGNDSSVERIVDALERIAVASSPACLLPASPADAVAVVRVELMTHPGHPVSAPSPDFSASTRREEHERAGCGGPLGPDAFSQCASRKHELEVLVALKSKLAERGFLIADGRARVRLVSWKESFEG